MDDFETRYYREAERAAAAEAKLSKLLDLDRAWGKGEPTEAVMHNVRRVLYDLPLVDEPTWAYGHD